MQILLPVSANPFIDPLYPRKCRMAKVEFLCPAVDKDGCCTVYFPAGIAKANRTLNCIYKSIRKPVQAKKGKKVNPIKKSKREGK